MTLRSALITGGAKRIGAAICRALAESGYAVVIHCNRSQDEAKALRAEIRGKGGQASIVTGDLADLDALPALLQRASEPFGVPELIINNASVFPRGGLETLTPKEFTATLAINLQAPVLLAKAFAEALPPDVRGMVINIIDQRVLKPTPLDFSYSLSKAGLYSATKMLAQALAPRIRVNAVGPGPTLPNLEDGAEGFRREAEGTLLGTPTDPREIANAVLFLAKSSGITGQMIAVDSGQHLGWKTPDIIE